MTNCKYCDLLHDTDYDAEHENECRTEQIWDDVLNLLISLKGRELITESEYKTIKEDFELIINDIRD